MSLNMCIAGFNKTNWWATTRTTLSWTWYWIQLRRSSLLSLGNIIARTSSPASSGGTSLFTCLAQDPDEKDRSTPELLKPHAFARMSTFLSSSMGLFSEWTLVGFNGLLLHWIKGFYYGHGSWLWITCIRISEPNLNLIHPVALWYYDLIGLQSQRWPCAKSWVALWTTVACEPTKLSGASSSRS